MSEHIDALLAAAERGGHGMSSKGADIIPFERGSAGEAAANSTPADAAAASRPEQGETWRRLGKALTQAGLSELDCVLDSHNEAIWVYQQHFNSLGYSRALLHDVRKFQSTVVSVCADPALEHERPFNFLIWGSRRPGVFNLGGDLNLFVHLIRNRDRGALAHYAKTCVDACFSHAIDLNLPIVTVAMVQGDALGGGFESVLGSDVIIAESHAKFGLPEILFGLFPAMGAYSFLGRRIGAKAAEEMIMSGRIFTARELADRGIVDRVAEPGEGEAATRAFIGEARRKFGAYRSIYQVRRRFHPLTYDEMIDIANLWVEAALTLEEAHVRRMTTLAAAQMRRQAPAADQDEKPAKPVA
jgi:DSF synthase